MWYMILGALIFMMGMLFGVTIARMPPVSKDNYE